MRPNISTSPALKRTPSPQNLLPTILVPSTATTESLKWKYLLSATSSTSSKWRYLDTSSLLPANAPTKHAHIIDLSSIDDELSSNPSIWDAVATVLFQAGPEMLEWFLHSRNKTFRFVRKEGLKDWNLIIWRKGCEVLIALFRPQSSKIKSKIFYEWDKIIRCMIGYNGSWSVYYGAWYGVTGDSLEEAWDDTFEKVNEGYPRESPKNERQMENVARSMAWYLLLAQSGKEKIMVDTT
ncbi:uncharacterized protein BDR25DRAFT_312483 [Lindgomyces ingoldianus]|uniref:Uncharacterized protein n=1 Tax=Lindgomyces ingoldianus TaxID=673940 RepID=A0ACB6R2T9_9PLEO|nr:uncharacterized protein BDR25DRAFT_312483 [Lindgomyces ingoldianus]KAF2473415.1 hypothetical protein BDR25DRAFT_312483 [Lindgomyces ingoldianus]